MRPLWSALVVSVATLLPLAGCAPRVVVEERVVERAAPDRVSVGDQVSARGLSAADSAAVLSEVTATLRRQEAAWNEGNLRGFMDVYLRVRATTFLSGGSVRQGWQDAYYAYERAYPDRATMGTLAFSDLSVKPLTRETALAWGRWRLTREATAGGDATPGGLFTLLLERRGDDWRIVHDHTSSE